jgi:predicted dehydrogenase
VARIAELGLLVGVAEQTPFLPLEQLKQQLVALGVLGHVTLAENDFAVFDYHGLAALRRGMGHGRVPVSVTARDVAVGGVDARVATVAMGDGSVLEHRFGTGDGPPPRRPRLTLVGSAGSIEGGELRTTGPDGSPAVATVRREEYGGSLHALVVDGPEGEIRWRNPFAGLPFDDEQVAVATVLVGMAAAVRSAEDPPYLASESLLDMELLAAMRYSAAGRGRPVSLPTGRLDQLRAKLGR